MAAKIIRNLDLAGGYVHAIAVVPNDNIDLPFAARGIYVGVAGHIAVLLQADSPDTASVIFTNVQAGQVLPICAARVLATGTTATGLIAVA